MTHPVSEKDQIASLTSRLEEAEKALKEKGGQP